MRAQHLRTRLRADGNHNGAAVVFAVNERPIPLTGNAGPARHRAGAKLHEQA